jgi:taurine transport system substrate-binding protein
MKKIVVLLLVIVLATSLTAAAGAQSLPDKVTVGTQTLADPEGIVKAEGWLSDAMGVDVDIVVFDAGRDVNTAMAAGSIDFGMLGSVPAALAIANGVDCKMIYIQSVLGEVESLAVRGELNVTTPEQLAGLTIATPFSSTSHYSLLKYLECNNIDPTTVDIVDMKASETVAAFIRGDIDGAFIWDPQLTELVNNGAAILTSAKEVAELGYATMDVELVNSAFAAQYPELVTAYVKSVEKAVQLYKADPAAAGEALSQNIGLTPEECLKQVASSTWLTVEEQLSDTWFGSTAVTDNLYDTAMFLYQQGNLLEEPSKDLFTAAVDSQFLQGAAE